MVISGIKIIRKRDIYNKPYIIFNETKRKAWNKLVKNGWIVQPNNRYLKYGRMYAYNNKLQSWLSVSH